MDETRYVIQYYSYVDGGPSKLGVMSEAELLGPDVKLYPTSELWKERGAEDSEDRAARMRNRLHIV